MWTAREAERTLGRMITAAREAGDLASDGQYQDDQEAVVSDDTSKITTLDDLGISRDLAAYAVMLAKLTGLL